MHFEAKIILGRKNLESWVSDVCGILFFVSLVVYAIVSRIEHNSIIAIWLPFLGFFMGILSAIFRKRNVTHLQVSDTELSVSAEGIKVGDQYYRLSEIRYLDFLVNGHFGMRAGRVQRWSFKRARIDGTENQLLFTYNGKQISYRFFLEDAYSMRRLEMLFREFYAKQIFFRERNRGGRTFLFQQVISKQDLERAKREEGYV